MGVVPVDQILARDGRHGRIFATVHMGYRRRRPVWPPRVRQSGRDRRFVARCRRTCLFWQSRFCRRGIPVLKQVHEDFENIVEIFF